METSPQIKKPSYEELEAELSKKCEDLETLKKYSLKSSKIAIKALTKLLKHSHGEHPYTPDEVLETVEIILHTLGVQTNFSTVVRGCTCDNAPATN